MKNQLLVILFSILVSTSYCQSLFKLDLTERGVLDLSFPLPLFEFNKGLIYYDSITYQLTIPSEYQNGHSAIGLIFYKGITTNKIPDHLPILVTQNDSGFLMILDSDNDLDFTNEQIYGLTDTLIFSTTYGESIEAMALVKPFKPLNEDIKISIEKSVTSNPIFNGNSFLDVKDWFEVQRINYKSGQFVIDNDSVQIGLIDGNANYKFSDTRWDRAFTAPYNLEKKNDQSIVSRSINKKTFIEVNKKFYVITDIDPFGNYLILKKVDNGLHVLEKGDTTPTFLLTNFDGKTSDISSYYKKNEYTLLYFWGTWCKPCVEKMPKLNQIGASYKNLNILGINSFDIKEKADKLAKDKGITWENFTASKKIIDSFGVQAFPRYVLINRDGIIVFPDSSIEEIIDVLNE